MFYQIMEGIGGAAGFLVLMFGVAWLIDGRPVPGRKCLALDWEHVYAMEREVWNQTFDHAGAPSPKRSHPPTGISTHLSYPMGERVKAALEGGIATPNEVRGAYFHCAKEDEYHPLTLAETAEYDRLNERMKQLDALIEARQSTLLPPDVIAERTRAVREERRVTWEAMRALLEARCA